MQQPMYNALYASDEFGRPFILLREQTKKIRVRGIEALKRHITAARSVAKILSTSLGPQGLDKILVSPDGDVTITNDGATILGQIQMEDQIAKLLVELSKSQDDEIGDGTTGVVLLAGALFEQAETLLDKGIHPVKICEGFEEACNVAVDYMESISDRVKVDASSKGKLVEIAQTSLRSKIVTKCQDKFANFAVDAVMHVADMERKDVNFELIKVEGKSGGSLDDSMLVYGVIINKDFSHPQMPKHIKDAKIAILACPFEPPKPKTKHKLNITSKSEYTDLLNYEQGKFVEMIKMLKISGVNCVMCQWGFDDEANHLLYQHGLPAVRWVGGPEIELLAISTRGRIIPRFEEITENKLGTCGSIKEVQFGTTKDRMIFVEECSNPGVVTILIRGGNNMIVEEAKRSIHDAICVVRNIIKDNRVVYGGGSVDVACSLAVTKAAEQISSVKQQAMLGFAMALETIPMQLAENSGYSPIEMLSEIKSRQIKMNNNRIGLNFAEGKVSDMRDMRVMDPFISKRSQFYLATQMVKMILKIDDVIITDSDKIE